MRVLLDTHAFLWFITDDPKLSVTGGVTIADPAHDILISPASYWEIAIKVTGYPVIISRDSRYLKGTGGLHRSGFKSLSIR